MAMSRRYLLAVILFFSSVAAGLAEEAGRLRILIVVDTLSDEAAFDRRVKNKTLVRTGLVQELRKAKLQSRYTVDVLDGEKATLSYELDRTDGDNVQTYSYVDAFVWRDHRWQATSSRQVR